MSGVARGRVPAHRPFPSPDPGRRRGRSPRRALAARSLAAALALAVGAPHLAYAQGQPGDKAAAEVLFNEGRALLSQNKLNEACAKLAESNRLDTGIGTMLYLAECLERSGKTASAWAQFREAQSIASREKDAREKVAKARADKLEAKLSKLVIVVPPDSDVPELTVTRDGVTLGRALWGEDTPVDPGTHVIRASAPGRAPYESQVTIQAGAPKARVVIPVLEPASSPQAEHDAAVDGDHGTPQTKPGTKLPPRRIVALGLGGLGVVGIGLGTYFGLRATSTLGDADHHCDARFCDKVGLGLRDDARSQALVSTVSFVVAGAAIAGGLVLWFTTPPAADAKPSTQATLVPVPLPGGGAIAGAVRF